MLTNLPEKQSTENAILERLPSSSEITIMRYHRFVFQALHPTKVPRTLPYHLGNGVACSAINCLSAIIFRVVLYTLKSTAQIRKYLFRKTSIKGPLHESALILTHCAPDSLVECLNCSFILSFYSRLLNLAILSVNGLKRVSIPEHFYGMARFLIKSILLPSWLL